MARHRLFLDPFRELSDLQHRINSLFHTGRWWSDWRTPVREFPPMNVTAVGGEVRVSIELPGVSLGDIDLAITGDTLTVKGERRPDQGISEAAYQRQEREFGRFARTIRLTEPVDGDKAEATYADGILEIRIPKTEEAKPRVISIRSE